MKPTQDILDTVHLIKNKRVEVHLLNAENGHPIYPALGTGRFLFLTTSEIASVLYFNLCVHRNYNPAVLEDNNRVFGMSYADALSFYRFTARFVSIGESIPSRIPEHAEDILADLSGGKEYKVYLLKAIPLTFPEPFKRPTRRNYFRVNHELTIYYEVIPANEINNLQKHDFDPKKISGPSITDNFPGFSKLITVDIGGGGFKGTTGRKLAVGSMLDCVITGIPEPLPFYAKVLNTKPSKSKDGFYEIRAEFKNVNEVVRDQLVQHLFDITREKRKIN